MENLSSVFSILGLQFKRQANHPTRQGDEYIIGWCKNEGKKEECRKQVKNFYTRMTGTIMCRINTRKKEQLASADAGTGAMPPECESNAGNVCYVTCFQFRVTAI